jgi:hypothetical protein
MRTLPIDQGYNTLRVRLDDLMRCTLQLSTSVNTRAYKQRERRHAGVGADRHRMFDCPLSACQVRKSNITGEVARQRAMRSNKRTCFDA